MKTALVITGDEFQFVFTPETEAEEKLLDMLPAMKEREIDIYRGSFFKCQGGWNRFGRSYTNPYGVRQNDESTIICMRPKKEAEAQPETVLQPDAKWAQQMRSMISRLTSAGDGLVGYVSENGKHAIESWQELCQEAYHLCFPAAAKLTVERETA